MDNLGATGPRSTKEKLIAAVIAIVESDYRRAAPVVNSDG